MCLDITEEFGYPSSVDDDWLAVWNCLVGGWCDVRVIALGEHRLELVEEDFGFLFRFYV